MKEGKWIVIIEDDLDMHHLYKRVFSNLLLDQELKLFDNAVDALNFLHASANETQLIFSDINMPTVDGIELRKRINRGTLQNLKSIPFVFLSTSASQSDIGKSFELGIQGFFRKGETLQEIENTIRTILRYWGKSISPSWESQH